MRPKCAAVTLQHKEMKLLSTHLLFDADGPAHNAAGEATNDRSHPRSGTMPARPAGFLRKSVNSTTAGNARGLTA